MRTWPSNSSSRGAPGCERSSRRATSRALRATDRPSTESSAKSRAPSRGMRQRRTPVSTSNPAASCFTLRPPVPSGAAARAERTSGPARDGPALTAWPVHLIDPSGQYASGQLCSGTSRPSDVWSASASRCWIWPCGHGTPQLTPCAVGGAPSSQCSVTGVDRFDAAALTDASARATPQQQVGSHRRCRKESHLRAEGVIDHLGRRQPLETARSDGSPRPSAHPRIAGLRTLRRPCEEGQDRAARARTPPRGTWRGRARRREWHRPWGHPVLDVGHRAALPGRFSWIGPERTLLESRRAKCARLRGDTAAAAADEPAGLPQARGSLGCCARSFRRGTRLARVAQGSPRR